LGRFKKAVTNMRHTPLKMQLLKIFWMGKKIIKLNTKNRKNFSSIYSKRQRI
jgi:hypothetical protein